MNKSIALLLALALSASLLTACGGRSDTKDAPVEATESVEAAEKPTAEAAAENAEPADFFGCWEDENGKRASMTIAPGGERGDAEVVIHWGNTSRETAEWVLYAAFDEASGVLSYRDGVQNTVTWNDAREPSTRRVRSDSSGTLRLTATGSVQWSDVQTAESASCSFVRTEAAPPTVESVSDELFRAVGSGDADVAYEAFLFAYRIDALSQDEAALRGVLRVAWEGMSLEERNAFDASYPEILHLIDECLSHYEGVRAAFDEALVGAEMGELLDSMYCRACWARLCDGIAAI